MPTSRGHAAFALVFLLAGASACRLDVEYSGRFACDEATPACPDGHVCELGLCIDPLAPSAPQTPDAIDAAAAAEPPDAAGPGGPDTDADAETPDAAPAPAPDAAPAPIIEVSFGERTDAMVRVVTTDTYLAQDRSGSNFGDEDQVDVDAIPDRSGLLRFDLSSVPPGTRCSEAELLVRFDNGLEDADLRLYALREDWVENQASWNRRRSGLPWSVEGALEGAHAPLPMGTVAPREPGEYTIPLDPLVVEAWILAPASNFGMVWLSTSLTGRGATFASSEASDAAARPLLRLRLLP